MAVTAATIEIDATIDLAQQRIDFRAKTLPGPADPYLIQAKLGDKIIWNFPDIPDYQPAVVFTSFTKKSQFPNQSPLDLGAFESLVQTGNQITGVVGPGGIGLHEYWFWLVPQKPGLSYRRLFCGSHSQATVIDRIPPG